MNYEQTLEKLILEDERFIVMTAENRAAIRGLPAKIGGRFIDTGITEQTMIGAAAGLALRGRIPVTHALATFLTLRAFEFIRSDVGIANLPVKLVGAVPGFLSDGNGPTHQAIEDVSIMRGIPNMGVFAPADEKDMIAGLVDVLKSPSPFYVRYNSRPSLVDHAPFEMGKAEVISEGNDVAILTYGTLFSECWQAAASLRETGLGVHFVNMRTLKPLDEKALLEAIERTKLVVTVEDHFLTGGLFTILAEVCLKNRKAPEVLPLGLDNTWYKPGRFQEVLEYEGFTGKRIAERIKSRWDQMKRS